MKKPKKSINEIVKHKPSNGNKLERQLMGETKKLRQKAARAGNEIYKKKHKRKAKKKEKQILKELKILMENVKLTLHNILQYRGKWIDQLRLKKVKLEKMIERGNRIKDNVVFERGQIFFWMSGKGN